MSIRRGAVRIGDEEEDAMARYLLSIYQPDGGTPPPEVLEAIGRELHAINEDMKAAGAWVFAAGLHAPSTATVVRARDRELVITDGPYVEGKEHIGGFWIVEAPDLDQALEWAGRAARALTLPVEVRPFQDRAEY
jgi:hypothetical protein